MATVHIPAPLRTLTGGQAEVTAPGETLGEVMDRLAAEHPGLKERLTNGDRIRAGFAVFVDGVSASPYLNTRLDENAEVYFAPAIAGG
ncbi:MAG: MoaD/ThiS family protein [Armatimonadetes bacterium]|nr:MoaD/ThiS family protein [Armatimonadota bacterium]